MKIQTYSTMLMLTGICLIIGEAVYSGGGISNLLSVGELMTVFTISLPLMILWGVSKSARGTAVPRSAMIILIVFILLDLAVYLGALSKLSDFSNSIVMAMIASSQVLLPLLMIVGAIVSRAREQA